MYFMENILTKGVNRHKSGLCLILHKPDFQSVGMWHQCDLEHFQSVHRVFQSFYYFDYLDM